MTTQPFGRILHSEQRLLRTLTHATRSVFQELKCKYYPPNKNNPKGSRPDFLNAQELKAADISKASYQRAIRDLLTVGLVRIADYKAINGRQCRLFDYPHEVGVFKEIPQSNEAVEEGVIVSPSISRAQRDTSKDHGQPFKDIQGIRASPEGIMVSPDRPNRELPFRKEDKKIRKEDTEEAGDGVDSIVSEEDLLHEDLPLKDLEATLKEPDSKIYTQNSDPIEVTSKKNASMNSLTPFERQLYKDAIVLLEPLYERVPAMTRTEAEAEGLLTRLHGVFSKMKAYPALAEIRKQGIGCVSDWLQEHPTVVTGMGEDFVKSLTPVEAELYKDALVSMEQLRELERMRVPVREKFGAVEGVIDQLHEKLSEMKAFPALAEYRKVGIDWLFEWVRENGRLTNVAVRKLVDQLLHEEIIKHSTQYAAHPSDGRLLDVSSMDASM
jgi:hypothetical protein